MSKEEIMTTKQRAYLKGLAMNIDPIFQCGKSSITPEFVNAVAEALEKRELIKIRVLENSGYSAKEAASEIAEAINCDVVACVGSKIVLYKPDKDNPKIQLPK